MPFALSRTRFPGLFGLLYTLAACTGTAEEPAPIAVSVGESIVEVATLTTDLEQPWGMDFLPDGNMLITEKAGGLKRFNPVSGVLQNIGNLPAVADIGQGGMLDVLVDPYYDTTGWVYFTYAVAEGKTYSTRASRARIVDDKLTDLEVLFTAQPYFPERRHFGSRLLLDGEYLYITVGDRGNRDRAQRLDSHNGKVMRLTRDGKVPADNPFVGREGAMPEIFSFGHRNPQGIAKHPHNGAIWVAEHGPQGGDEVNAIRAGANYGWPIITYGEEYGGGKIGEGVAKPGMEQPLVYYVPSIATGGISFYTGDVYPNWSDSLLVSGLRLTQVSRLTLVEDGVGERTRMLADLDMRIRDVQQGPDGLVYLLANNDRLLRLQRRD